MARMATGLISSLAILYRSYGGLKSLLRSEYFYLSLCVAGLCWRMAWDGTWSDLARNILPTLSGFTIAAYAIFFAVLDERAREALRAPAEALDNRSPLLILASSISHAVVVQIAALILAIIFFAKPFPTILCAEEWAIYTNIAYSSVGLFLTIYGVMLILASILSIFRILEIRSRL